MAQEGSFDLKKAIRWPRKGRFDLKRAIRWHWNGCFRLQFRDPVGWGAMVCGKGVVLPSPSIRSKLIKPLSVLFACPCHKYDCRTGAAQASRRRTHAARSGSDGAGSGDQPRRLSEARAQRRRGQSAAGSCAVVITSSTCRSSSTVDRATRCRSCCRRRVAPKYRTRSGLGTRDRIACHRPMSRGGAVGPRSAEPSAASARGSNRSGGCQIAVHRRALGASLSTTAPLQKQSRSINTKRRIRRSVSAA